MVVKPYYDILIVGCGLTSATFCASLKHKYKILVIDTRNHIGGNCYDKYDCGSFIHMYGPHNFNSPNKSIVDFLSKYTEWDVRNFKFDAEIEYNNQLIVTPFPYSKLNNKILGKDITEDEIIDLYFKGYSQKMWGYEWKDLPNIIRNRVPKYTEDKPNYYPGKFVGFPKNGYTHMFENMFDGVDIKLNVDPNEWRYISAKTVIYTGRPDLIIPEENIHLGFRTLDIIFEKSEEKSEAIRNFCHTRVPYTRKVWYKKLTGGNSNLCSIEVPKMASYTDINPFYPMQFNGNVEKYQKIRDIVKIKYPNLIMAGRLGSYMYLDMWKAVAQSLAIVKSKFGDR